MKVLGVMSGTSYDAIEVAAADFDIQGDALKMRLLGSLTVPFTAETREQIGAILPPSQTTIEAVCRLDTILGQEFGQAAAESDKRLCAGQAELVASHGQTVFHWVEGGRAFGTLQLGQPAWIAEITGLPVVSDFHIRDIACGGQGAPLVGIMDTFLLQNYSGTRGALNLGGIANMTILPESGNVLSYDVGPGNALLDATVGMLSCGRAAFDRDGALASRGKVSDELLRDFMSEPFLALEPPKSTGKEVFNVSYVRDRADKYGVTGSDLLATIAEFTAQAIGRDCRRHGLKTLLASGGGVKNGDLMKRIERACTGTRILLTSEIGFPVDTVEAYAQAQLGYYSIRGLPGVMAETTGAERSSVLGSITPGRKPLDMRLAEVTPRRLEVLA